MKRNQIWLACVIFTFIQLVYGNAISLFALTGVFFLPHLILPLIILGLNILGIFVTKDSEKRLAIANLILLIITFAVGGYLYTFFNAILVLIHFIIALGIFSNFIVLYLIEIYKKKE